MQMRARDSAAYYSCDDHFVVVDKTVDYGRGGSMSDRSSASEIRPEVQPLHTSRAPHMPSMYFNIVNVFVFWIAYCLYYYIYNKKQAVILIIFSPLLGTSYSHTSALFRFLKQQTRQGNTQGGFRGRENLSFCQITSGLDCQSIRFFPHSIWSAGDEGQ
jgi:hypothetical protein